ncbi:MAG: nitrilase-related carbon-nitrogen hydrolase [bacterium]
MIIKEISKKFLYSLFFVFYAWLIMYFLKFKDYHSLIWFSFVPVFYYIYYNSVSNKKIKIELFCFSLTFMVSYLFGFTEINRNLYVLIYLFAASWLYLVLFLSYKAIKINFYLPAIIFVLLEKILLDFLPFYSVSLFTVNGVYIKQFASLFGTSGITFVIVLFNLLITRLIIRKDNLKDVLFFTIILCLIISYGYFYINYENNQDYINQKALIVQTALTNEDKDYYFGGPLEIMELMVFYEELIGNEEADIILLPEASIKRDRIIENKGLFEDFPNILQEELPRLSRKIESDMIIGITDYPVEQGDIIDNYLLYYDNEKENYIYKYNKELMVPQYETSFKNYFMGFTTKENKNFKKYKTLICYEGLFENLMKQELKDNGAIFVLSNNNMLGKNKLPDEMLKFYILRSISLKRNIVVADNWGYSVMINQNGEIVSILDKYSRGKLTGNISLIYDQSFYYKHGYLFIYLNMIILIYVLKKSKKIPSNLKYMI